MYSRRPFVTQGLRNILAPGGFFATYVLQAAFRNAGTPEYSSTRRLALAGFSGIVDISLLNLTQQAI